MIRRGEEWGRPSGRAAEITLTGDDTELAACVREHPGALIRFDGPRSDLARALGITRTPQGIEVDVDAIHTTIGIAVNMAVLGTPPDRTHAFTRTHPMTVGVDERSWFRGRATAVVVANGQFLRGADLVPRGHPGDGVLEVQTYALPRGQRRAMRQGLATGSHLPHPEIRVTTGRRIRITCPHALAIEIDGELAGSRRDLEVVAAPAAFRLLV